ncbi:MAG: RNA-binding protein [Desulfobacteraceae bacterium]
MNFYITNLAYGTTENTLKALFEEFGEIDNVKIIKDRFSGRSKGFGFLDMPNNSEADKAIKALNGTMLEGKMIKIQQAEPESKKKKRSSKKKRF